MSDPGSPRPRLFRWQALLHAAVEAVFVLDRRHRLVFVNRAWETLTCVTAERARGLRLRRPRPGDPVEHDFAWALIAIDGTAGTSGGMSEGTSAIWAF